MRIDDEAWKALLQNDQNARPTIVFDLFLDVSIRVTLRPFPAPSSDTVAWVEADEGAKGSAAATLTLFGAKGDKSAPAYLAASLQVPGGRIYDISPAGDSRIGYCIVSEPDLTTCAACGVADDTARDEPQAAPAPGAKGPRGPSAPAMAALAVAECDTETTTTVQLELLAAYTTEAANFYGGESTLRTIIRTAVTSMNKCLSRSDARASFHLADRRVVDWPEAGTFADILCHLVDTTDTVLNAVSTSRNELSADVVVLVVKKNSETGWARVLDSCGAGTVSFCQKSYHRADLSYCVVSGDNLVANRTMAHEVGHLLGCGHEPLSAPAMFNWAHGFQLAGHDERTVLTGGSPRIERYSNAVKYCVIGGEHCDFGDTDHDNARTIRRTANFVAAFR